jgi:hypothetical protein
MGLSGIDRRGARAINIRYTHKTSSYWTSTYKMSSYKTSIYQTSSYKTSRLQNVLITKRPYYQMSRLPNVQLPYVQLQNVHISNYYKTSSSFFPILTTMMGFHPLKKMPENPGNLLLGQPCFSCSKGEIRCLVTGRLVTGRFVGGPFRSL